MIKLYLHIGYHKTGSSYLQSLFALNKSYLLKNNIYFPVSENINKMIAGEISPGNGMDLVAALQNNKESIVKKILDNWKREAINKNAKIILISSESLFHVLAKKEAMQLLFNACRSVRIFDINGLLFFRDPVPHVLSVYKHRGKKGNISDYGRWINTKYETLELTDFFLDHYKEFGINWTFRKYQPDSEYMIKVTFKDWLLINLPEVLLDKKVNISLTLSEILMINEISKLVPKEFIRKIHLELSELPKLKKSKDLSIQEYYFQISTQELIKYDLIINEINKVLPKGEKIIFDKYIETDKVYKEEINLSREQIRIFVDYLEKSKKQTNIFYLFLKRKMILINKELKRFYNKFAVNIQI